MAKYFKFTKDHPQSGGKEGEIQVAQGKIPPHLANYVKEIKKEEYDKYQLVLQEEADAELTKRLKAQQKEAKQAEEAEQTEETDALSVEQNTPHDTEGKSSRRNRSK